MYKFYGKSKNTHEIETVEKFYLFCKQFVFKEQSVKMVLVLKQTYLTFA